MKRDPYDPRPRWYRTGIIGLLVCLVLGGIATLLLPPATEVPVGWVSVSADDPGTGQWYAGELVRAESTQEMYAGDSTTPTLESAHQLIVVELRISPLREPELLTGLWLRTTDGREYSQIPPSRWGFTAVQPGFTMTAVAVFEIPADARPDVLEVRPDPGGVIVYAEGLRVDVSDAEVTPASHIPEQRTVEVRP